MIGSLSGCKKTPPENLSAKDDEGERGSKASKTRDDDDRAGGPAKDAFKFACDASVESLENVLKGRESFTARCPSDCTNGTIYGTFRYTTDSALCVAALHAGAIDVDKGGFVKVKITKGLPHYRDTKLHGIRSSDWGKYEESFYFPDFPGDESENAKLSCGQSPNDLGKDPGDTFTVTCPEDCTEGAIYGTDAYTTDSSICVAAVHAGVVKADKGGRVTVKVVKGRNAYKGSKHNGVRSDDWGEFNESFSVE
ncbi:MAG: hypothetical protein NVS3B20_15960 [Polyangiales bacterium]